MQWLSTIPWKKYLRLGAVLLIFFAVLAVVSPSLAQSSPAPADTFGLQSGAQSGLSSQDIRLTIAKIIRAVLELLGIIALVLFLYGGYLYMTALGNEEQIGQAKRVMVNAVIGIAIILSSLAIVQFILSKLAAATGFDSSGPPASA